MSALKELRGHPSFPQDKRRVLKSTPPPIKTGRMVHVYLSPDEYERLYFAAFDAGRSLSDQVRALIAKETDDDNSA